MAKQPDGLSLIAQYYAAAPKIVDAIDRSGRAQIIYQTLRENALEMCLDYINRGEHAKAFELYLSTFAELAQEFIPLVITRDGEETWPPPVVGTLEDMTNSDERRIWDIDAWIEPIRPPKPNVAAKSKSAVITIGVGERGQEMLAISEPGIEAYARRIGADYVAIRESHCPWQFAEKFLCADYLRVYDRIIYLDADIIVRSTAPNLFAVVPADMVGIQNDLPYSTQGCKWYYEEVELVQRWQQMRTFPPPYCLNTGLFVASSVHADIFRVPDHPFKAIHCAEQHLITARLHACGVPIFLFDQSIHWQQWADLDKAVYSNGQFLHFSGVLDHRKRLAMMRGSAAEVESDIRNKGSHK